MLPTLTVLTLVTSALQRWLQDYKLWATYHMAGNFQGYYILWKVKRRLQNQFSWLQSVGHAHWNPSALVHVHTLVVNYFRWWKFSWLPSHPRKSHVPATFPPIPSFNSPSPVSSHWPASPAGSWHSLPWTDWTEVGRVLSAWSRPAAEPCVPSPGPPHCSSALPPSLPPGRRCDPQHDVSPPTGNYCMNVYTTSK